MNTPLLAKDHAGFTVNGHRILSENGRGFSAIRAGMAKHLNEVAQRYYSGDVTVVDEFLQLYCFGEEARKLLRTKIT